MKISHLSHESVLHVIRNMRERDREEIYNVRFDDNPFHLLNDVMAHQQFAWVGWLGEKPVAVFGGAQEHPGVWSMFAFATDDFPRIALALTRFGVRVVIPTLFGQVGAHRLHCDSHEKHASAHKWLKNMGAEREAVKSGYGRDGADYFTFVIRPKRSTKSTT